MVKQAKGRSDAELENKLGWLSQSWAGLRGRGAWARLPTACLLQTQLELEKMFKSHSSFQIFHQEEEKVYTHQRPPPSAAGAETERRALEPEDTQQVHTPNSKSTMHSFLLTLNQPPKLGSLCREKETGCRASI